MTANKGLQTPPNNADIGTWDVPVNANMQTIDQAFGAVTTINTNGASGTIGLSAAQCVPVMMVLTGSPAGALTYQVPAGVGGFFLVWNATNAPVGINSAVGGQTVVIAAGYSAMVACDASYGARAGNTIPPAPAGSNEQVQFNNNGAFAGAAGLLYDPGTQNAYIGGGLTVGQNLNIGGAVGRLAVQGNAATAPITVAFNAGGSTFDCSLSNVFNIVMSGNMGVPNFANQADGQTINVRFQQDGAGGRTIAWPGGFHWPGGNVVPVLSTPAGWHDVLVATYFASIGAWFCTLVKGFA
jgi:hypothetical protein